MPEIYLISTLLMGILVIAVVATMARMGQRATPSGHAGTRSGYAEWSSRTASDESGLVNLAKTPSVWTITFIGLVAAFIAGAVLLVGEGEFVDVGIIEPIVLGIGGAVLLGYIFFGTYFAARDRFGNSATGVAVASALLGFLGLIAVVVVLLLG